MIGIWTSPDGQWIATRRGRDLALIATSASELHGGPGRIATAELPPGDVDVAFVGSQLTCVSRGDDGTRILLYEPPTLEITARHELEAPARLACVIGGRMALIGSDGKQVTIVRVAPRAVATQALDAIGAVEFAVGLEKNQVLLSILKKLEVWDAMSGRPVLRLQLQLPPPPRLVGSAQGHLWVVRPGSDEVFIYRLSDGRPFRHHVGAPVSEVVSHPGTPLVVLATPRGLVRLHCFAHSLAVVEAPWSPGQALAQLAIGEDITLLGFGDDGADPWRVPIGGTGAQLVAEHAEALPVEMPPTAPPVQSAADKLREMRANQHAVVAGLAVAAAPSPPVAQAEVSRPVSAAHVDWRDALVPFAHDLAHGGDPEVPHVAADTELGRLAQRLDLAPAARRGLVALYALHLVGEPGFAIARLARAIGEWSEALGTGELAALALLDRAGARVALRRPVTDLLDGAPPRLVRLLGGAATAPRAGAARTGRDARTNAEIEAALQAELGRVAILDGGDTAADFADGLLEARLHGATAVAFTAPPHLPRPWPRDAGLVLVLPGSASAWTADLPNL